ncbi:fimbrial protein [Cellvibrio mixtus]|uniref:Fimbrial protein n=2 Tax=Cellvibrio mixtus TaxID=39650 RepID=A0A266QDN7_9GAMM|nr:type IV pilus secretin PilQ family protein [Cellvibrio mixtus]OZY87987.1 fimbrial protein [Cellvibrio mixtus]
MRKFLLVLTGVLVAPLSLANTLTDIGFFQLPGERFEVRMAFDSPPQNPQGYTIEKPARIVLDFPDAISALKERRFPLAVDNGQSAMVLTSEGRTRLILNLNALASYTTRTDGNNFIVEVGAAKAADAKQAIRPSVEVAQKAGIKDDPVANQNRITNVDFRRGTAGEGRIIVSLSNPKVSADMVGTGAGVRLTFKDVWLPPELRRRLDVVDFATPVSLVSAAQEGESSVLNISAGGDFDYLAYQTDKEYVVSIKPLTEQEKLEKKKDFEYTGEKLSLDFQDIEVRAVLQIIADFTDLNLVASDTVQGRITLRLQNVPWDQALEMVLKNKGLDKRQVGNVLMVAPAAEIAERERQEITTKKQLEELAPLRTEYIRVRYANAKEMFELFRGDSGGGRSGGGGGRGGNQSTGSVLSERGQGVVDERTNSIIITDTAERIEAFKRLVDQIDIPIRQVMIEARVVIANTDFQRELGVRWGGIGYNEKSGDRIIDFAGSREGLDDTGGTSPRDWFVSDPADGKSFDLNEANVVDLAVANPYASAAIGILTDNTYLDLELSALENSGYAEIVSQPKVITSDKQLAIIKTGKEIGYQETAPSGGTTTGFREAVLKLEVTPQITPDNRIIMDLIVWKDSIGQNTPSGVPTVDITRLETKVLVNNGQTVVLGGVFSLEGTKGENKVPVLGDIPYLGRLFKKTVDNQFKTELLIFVTPKLMSDTLSN